MYMYDAISAAKEKPTLVKLWNGIFAMVDISKLPIDIGVMFKAPNVKSFPMELANWHMQNLAPLEKWAPDPKATDIPKEVIVMRVNLSDCHEESIRRIRDGLFYEAVGVF